MVCIKPVVHIMNKEVVVSVRRRREHSAEFKRVLVARSLEPGVSVAAIAMDNGINANLLFGWRRKHLDVATRAGVGASRQAAAVLLPVSIEACSREVHCASPTPTPTPTPASRLGSSTIEIEFGSARVRLRGAVDEANLRTVLTALRGLA